MLGGSLIKDNCAISVLFMFYTFCTEVSTDKTDMLSDNNKLIAI